MNVLDNYENQHLKELQTGKSYPKFNPGDTLKVHLKVKEGEKERIQVFEGICIAKKNAGINSSFTIRKISYGEGIERVLPLYSPQINKIEIVKGGDVRRSKLYYLRGRSGKSARIAEKNIYENIEKVSNNTNQTDSTVAKKSNDQIKKKSENIQGKVSTKELSDKQNINESEGKSEEKKV